jgi:hypothetical protein
MRGGHIDAVIPLLSFGSKANLIFIVIIICSGMLSTLQAVSDFCGQYVELI